jgi:hypothetical protein
MAASEKFEGLQRVVNSKSRSAASVQHKFKLHEGDAEKYDAAIRQFIFDQI